MTCLASDQDSVKMHYNMDHFVLSEPSISRTAACSQIIFTLYSGKHVKWLQLIVSECISLLWKSLSVIMTYTTIHLNSQITNFLSSQCEHFDNQSFLTKGKEVMRFWFLSNKVHFIFCFPERGRKNGCW